MPPSTSSLSILCRISGRGRPITLAFRQLHAAIDGRGQARRYWQGYLRLKTGWWLVARDRAYVFLEPFLPLRVGVDGAESARRCWEESHPFEPHGRHHLYHRHYDHHHSRHPHFRPQSTATSTSTDTATAIIAGDSVWTGLFYVLREDGSCASFPSKDIEGQTPVKVVIADED